MLLCSVVLSISIAALVLNLDAYIVHLKFKIRTIEVPHALSLRMWHCTAQQYQFTFIFMWIFHGPRMLYYTSNKLHTALKKFSWKFKLNNNQLSSKSIHNPQRRRNQKNGDLIVHRRTTIKQFIPIDGIEFFNEHSDIRCHDFHWYLEFAVIQF